VQVTAGTHRVSFSFHPIEGAIAEMREKISPPPEPEDDVPTPQPIVPDQPQIASPPVLSAPSRSTIETLRLGPSAPAAMSERPQVSSSRVY